MICPKCGNIDDQPVVEYRAGYRPPNTLGLDACVEACPRDEHLHVTCRRCSYWYSQPCCEPRLASPVENISVSVAFTYYGHRLDPQKVCAALVALELVWKHGDLAAYQQAWAAAKELFRA